MSNDSQTATLPAQEQKKKPGREHEMHPRPETAAKEYKPANKLKGKVAIVTGGDSGIGRAVSVAFAKEGADVAIVYLDEERDAAEAVQLIHDLGRRAISIRGDVGNSVFCSSLVDQVVRELGHIDILVNNAAEQHPKERIEDISNDQLLRTFQTNIFSMFYLARNALGHMKPGSSIINTTSVTAYAGSPMLLDYSATKGAIVSFTRSLALAVIDRGVRVNAVAPGPIWTPLIPSTFPAEKVEHFGSDTPMKRPGQPDEVAPCYVFLACSDSSYMSGQVLHPNGGKIING